MNRIYLDYAATTPMDPAVQKAMEPFFFERFGNASSPHGIGQDALKALEGSREAVALHIGAKPEEIVFNSGATEGNNHVFYNLAKEHNGKPGNIILSSIEHHSVLEPAEYLRSLGFTITYLPVDKTGLVHPADIAKTVTSDTVLIALIHASNEVGTIQLVSEVGKIARERKIPYLVDACQTVGHIPVRVDEIQCDYLSFSGHKLYGPKGVGTLYVRNGLPLKGFLLGGDQERGKRASTQNVAGIVGMAKALELCAVQMDQESQVQARLRDKLIDELPARVSGVTVNGHRKNRLPNNAHFSFEGLEGEALMMGLDMDGICVSMGSACTSGAMEPSHVLRAIGLSDKLAYGSIRITIGRWTTEEEINYVLEKMPAIVNRLRI